MSLRSKRASAHAALISAPQTQQRAAPRSRRGGAGAQRRGRRDRRRKRGACEKRTVSLLSCPAGCRSALDKWRGRPATQSPAAVMRRVSGGSGAQRRRATATLNPIAAHSAGLRRARAAPAAGPHRFERHARAQAGLGEDHGHRHAPQRLEGHVPRSVAALELRSAAQHVVQLRLCEVVDVDEVLERRAVRRRAPAAPRGDGGGDGGKGSAEDMSPRSARAAHSHTAAGLRKAPRRDDEAQDRRARQQW